MTRLKRVAYRLTEILDYRTFIVAGAFVTLGIVGYLIFAALQQAHDATEAQNRSRMAASRRIDLLNAQIEALQHEIAAGAEQRGDLAAKLAALAEQVRQLGGKPVVIITPTFRRTSSPTSTRPTSQPTPSPTSSAAPKPTRSPSPSPTPSPTCLLPILGC
jgi:hypothetical protein